MRLKTPPREQVKSWLLAIIEHSPDTATDIARRAGVATTTVTRFLNDPDHTGSLSRNTIKKIAQSEGVKPPDGIKIADPMKNSELLTGAAGFSEAEGTPYLLPDKNKPAQTVEQQAVSLIIATQPHVHPWRLKTDSLSALGYIRNDILFVDINKQAAGNDIVCAQHYNWHQGTALTIFRQYKPPYLMGASLINPTIQPLHVDGENVNIKGVVIASMRF